jgi:hypothetical protein
VASKIKVDTLETADGTGSIALSNQLSGMTVASLPPEATDAASLTGALPALDGSALTNMAAGGKVLQVIQTVKTSKFTSYANAWTTITGLSATITPSSASNRILVNIDISWGCGHYYTSAMFRVVRGSTVFQQGDAQSSNTRCWWGADDHAANSAGDHSKTVNHASKSIMDTTHNTTSAITYNPQILEARNGGSSHTIVINEQGDEPNGDVQAPQMISSLTLTEIGA